MLFLFRDIKPHNILLAQPDSESSLTSNDFGNDDNQEISSIKELSKYLLKISDMGLGKQLDSADGGSSSFASTLGGARDRAVGEGSGMRSSSSSGNRGGGGRGSGPVGTVGWQAPELLALRRSSGSSLLAAVEAAAAVEDEKIPNLETEEAPSSEKYVSMQTVDIFSLGCVFYYVLVPGEHPFGKWYERESNIMQGRCDLTRLRGLPDAADLLSRMLDSQPEGRPSAAQICKHPFFWDAQRRLQFLVDFSDRLEHEAADSPLVLAVESGAASVVGRSWDRKLHRELLEDIGKYRKYDSASVRDCLRLIRNKRHHFNELPAAVRTLMLPLPSGFILYFENRFPRLLLHCVTVCCRLLSEDKEFSTFCKVIAPLYRQQQPQTISQKNLQSRGAAPSDLAAQSQGTITTCDPSLDVKSPVERADEEDMITVVLCAEGCVDDLETPLESLASSTTATALADNETQYSDFGVMSGGSQDGGSIKSISMQIPFEQDIKNSSLQSSAPVTAIVVPGDAQHLVAGEGVIVWSGGALAGSLGCTGWWREASAWVDGSGTAQSIARTKGRPSHLTRSAADPKYRSRLCTHWELTGGGTCPMRKKGKCDFAHGPLELRVKEGRRGRWGQRLQLGQTDGLSDSLTASGGEDVLGAARSIERVRAAEGSVSEFEKMGRKPVNSVTGTSVAGGVPRNIGAATASLSQTSPALLRSKVSQVGAQPLMTSPKK